MVFGWGKKKEQEYTPQTQNILLSEIPDVISELLKRRESQTVSDIRSHRNSIIPLLDDISAIGKTLESDDLKIDDIDKNIRTIVVRGKKQVIDVIRKDIVKLPDISTYDDAVSLHNILNQVLKKVGDALGRQTRVIHIFAKKYAAKLKDILSEVNTGNSEIQKLLKNYEDSRNLHDEINDSLNQFSNIISVNAEAKAKIVSLNDNLVNHKEKITNYKKSIMEIKSSAQYTELERQKKTLEQLGTQKTKLDGRILDQFTKISRPLGRYEYTSSLDKDQKQILSELIRSPSSVLTKENKDIIILILENVKKGITSGSISVKDESKSMSQITNIENTLDDFISEISDHASQKTTISKTIKEITPTELFTLEKDLERTALDTSTIESRIASLQNEISTNESRSPQIIRDIQVKLRQLSNIRYIVSQN